MLKEINLETQNFEDLIANSFLRRVPALMLEGYDFENAVNKAYADEMAFLTELWLGKTEMAKTVRAYISKIVWLSCRDATKENIEKEEN